ESCQPMRPPEATPPPWAFLRRGYVQSPLVPAATICAVSRGADALHSPVFQGVAGPIARLYFAYFHRVPDAASLERWLAESKAGSSLTRISEGFANSPEFRSRYGTLTNERFVTLVYRSVLGREPDSVGRDHWVGLLDSGAMTRPQVMLGFAESPEYVRTFGP